MSRSLKAVGSSGLILIVFALAIQSAHADVRTYTETVKAGTTIQLATRAIFNSKCKVTDLPQYTVSVQPHLGKLLIRKEIVSIDYVGDPSHKNCIGMKLPGVGLYYSAGAKKGVDHVAYSRDNNGTPVTFEGTITIK